MPNIRPDDEEDVANLDFSKTHYTIMASHDTEGAEAKVRELKKKNGEDTEFNEELKKVIQKVKTGEFNLRELLRKKSKRRKR